ncbi:BA75_01541T0 [Komagataella pastoris]|uniref:BA75_01541T0 n=1 Tax=Komagataella pastoris TaxID=4922 RepID=A0A1B2J747_PICPA|nr:BA75_01541T0 [Komagataella pastoris]
MSGNCFRDTLNFWKNADNQTGTVDEAETTIEEPRIEVDDNDFPGVIIEDFIEEPLKFQRPVKVVVTKEGSISKAGTESQFGRKLRTKPQSPDLTIFTDHSDAQQSSDSPKESDSESDIELMNSPVKVVFKRELEPNSTFSNSEEESLEYLYQNFPDVLTPEHIILVKTVIKEMDNALQPIIEEISLYATYYLALRKKGLNSTRKKLSSVQRESISEKTENLVQFIQRQSTLYAFLYGT